MKRFFANACFLLAASSFFLTGCVKDTCKRTYTYTYYEPVYKTTAEVRANVKSNAPKTIEKPGKLFIRGNYIFLNEIDRGIHVIDNSNPAAPRNVAFIDIPGNLDVAVKGTTLFADLYTDLVTIDISNPLQVTATKFVSGVFPHRYFRNFQADTTKMISEWIKKDTTLTEDCQNRGSWVNNNRGIFMDFSAISTANGATATASVSPYGVGGSMARFALVNDRLYTVGTYELNVFNIHSANNPSYIKKSEVGWGIETIFPFRDKLFIGSTTGMFIYNISNPDNPVKTGQFAHVQSCDPVIADDTYAYVTLRSGSACRGFTNQMDILKLNDLSNPTLEKTYPLTNPHGLSKDGNLLFVCDGRDGLKIYNASDVKNLQMVQHITDLETYDVIAWNNIALVVAKDGLYQFDFSNLNNIRLLSKMGLTRS